MERLRHTSLLNYIGNRFSKMLTDRETLPALNAGGLLDQSYETIPESLSPKAKDIWGRREYGKRVNRSFRNYALEVRMAFLLPEEVALLRNLLAKEFITDSREKQLVANSRSDGPIPVAYQEIIDFNGAKLADFEQNVQTAFAKRNLPPGILQLCSEAINLSLSRLARGIKVAEMRDQPVDVKRQFIEMAIMTEQPDIIELHRMVGIY